jgi:glutathione-specific gamma-glutamylcyclotransferase
MAADEWLFAYGSLVNEKTWDSPRDARPVAVAGWIRQWRHCVHTPFGDVCGLTLDRLDGSNIEGLAMAVQASDWSRLNAREIGYERSRIDGRFFTGETASLGVYIARGETLRWASRDFPILLSYVDCILDGYNSRYGRAGVRAFVETTQGWDLPIIDDRSAPIYPRAIVLRPEFTAFVDAELARARHISR